MGKIEQFEDLPIWQSATRMAIDIYKLTDQGKLKSDFSMKDQIRRSAISVSSNIAEGFEYGNNREFVRFLKYAKGSAGELRSQLYILHKTNHLPTDEYIEFKEKVTEISPSNFRLYEVSQSVRQIKLLTIFNFQIFNFSILNL